jgi:hypothetical protein
MGRGFHRSRFCINGKWEKVEFDPEGEGQHYKADEACVDAHAMLCS